LFYVKPFMKGMQNLKLLTWRRLQPQALFFMPVSLIEVRGGKTCNPLPSHGYWNVRILLSFGQNLMPRDWTLRLEMFSLLIPNRIFPVSKFSRNFKGKILHRNPHNVADSKKEPLRVIPLQG
jgi:hypothetical protein